ncbi:MAG TPA: extracellular solute-binding protein [Acidimicrobiales bacterium]|nr:extracellular solute-binding protein [Acidimicrobiales bacterium]
MEASESQGMSRRQFLKVTGGLVVLAACGGTGDEPARQAAGAAAPTSSIFDPSKRLSGDLRILQWTHFVPRHDRWFDPFAQAWGREVGVNVTVDHIDLAELGTRLSAEISAREGHDLIELLSPPSAFEPSLLDLTDINQEAERRFGKQTPLCTRSTFNPTTNKFYGFCHGWAPDPGDFRRSLWERAGLPNGPSTYQELLDGGTRIKNDQGVQLGIGMSNEIDSNMAARALIWSFGGSVQDRDENVVFNSPETVEAVEFMVRLFKATMTPEVFAWNAASNNQGLIAGQLSYILNSISAYRTAQQATPDVANDVFFTAPLEGPRGVGLASEHVIPIYVIPSHARNPDAAKEFILNLVGNYAAATFNTELYTFPAFPDRVPQLDAWLGKDPFGSRPDNKLALLRDAERWSTNIGHPGPANAAVGEVFNTFVLPKMMARAAREEVNPRQAVADAEAEIKAIFARWRERRLVGGRT